MLPRSFAHWRYLFSAAVQLVVLFVRAAWFSKKRLPSVFGPDLPRLNANRFRHYFFGTIFLGAVFGRLRGRALSGGEVRAFANLAALAGFFDDLAEAGPVFEDFSLLCVLPGQPLSQPLHREGGGLTLESEATFDSEYTSPPLLYRPTTPD
ncbi:MAG: hypothetical protein ABMA02_15935, partial [Saprospiraceae bacterium]